MRVGLTQGEAASGLGISATLLVDIERGRKPLNDSRVDALADLYQVPVDEIRSAWQRAIDTREARLKTL
ncbi:helix-turn-helix domain-containing protein [Rhodococcoides fascians]|uniref:helix-turn-helix domain-containing protein n=1 Tax=Rhodococcoides fascians TaxID=1828 RepID=UPI000A6B1A35|nr:helix-turn-helix transcriptional regulator [Rhodococcus fascians]